MAAVSDDRTPILRDEEKLRQSRSTTAWKSADLETTHGRSDTMAYGDSDTDDDVSAKWQQPSEELEKLPAYFFPALSQQRRVYCLDVLKLEDIRSVSLQLPRSAVSRTCRSSHPIRLLHVHRSVSDSPPLVHMTSI